MDKRLGTSFVAGLSAPWGHFCASHEAGQKQLEPVGSGDGVIVEGIEDVKAY